MLFSVSSTLLDGLSNRNLLQLTSETDLIAITQWPPSEQPMISAAPIPTTRDQKIRCLKACIFMELLTTASKVRSQSASILPYDLINPNRTRQFEESLRITPNTNHFSSTFAHKVLGEHTFLPFTNEIAPRIDSLTRNVYCSVCSP